MKEENSQNGEIVSTVLDISFHIIEGWHYHLLVLSIPEGAKQATTIY